MVTLDLLPLHAPLARLAPIPLLLLLSLQRIVHSVPLALFPLSLASAPVKTVQLGPTLLWLQLQRVCTALLVCTPPVLLLPRALVV